MAVVQAVLVGAPVHHVDLAAVAVDHGAQPPAVGIEVVGRHERQAQAPRPACWCSYQALFTGPSESSTT